MRAAIYARKSTEQSGVADEHRSVARQIENAAAFARVKGWTVVDGHVYVDDGISGAEFEKRPGFIRLMNALAPRSFDVLIMSEESRLGREAIETAYALKQIISAGVRVFFYLDGSERTLQSPTDKLLMSVAAFADELERERARQRTHDALIRKAKAGHVTGGRVFGYDNVDVTDASGQRTHVERRINEDHARIIVRIFELAAGGMGMRRIALTLNESCAPAPRAQRGRPSAWCPSSVFEALRRDLYRGLLTWNKSKKRDSWGRHHQQARGREDWIEQPAEHLRIVPQPLWDEAHAALERRRRAYLTSTHGEVNGRPVAKASKYMLSGMVHCGLCGGSLVVRTNSRKAKPRAAALACWHYVTRGPTVCTNRTEAPLDAVTERVFYAIADRLFAPAVIDMARQFAVEALRAIGDGSDAARATEQLATLDAEADRLAALTAAGLGDLPAVIARLQAIKAQRATLTRAIDRARIVDSAIEDLDAAVDKRLADLRGVLERRAPEAKQVLEELLEGRIIVTPRTARGEFDVQIPLTAYAILEGFITPRACDVGRGRQT